MTVRGGRPPRAPVPGETTVRRPSGYRRTGRYGQGPGDQERFRAYGDPGGGPGSVLRFLLFLVVMAGLVLGVMVTVARPVVASIVVPLAEDNPGLLRVPFVADMVREDIGAALTDPASLDATEVLFTVEPGDTPATLAPRLRAAGLIANERAFLFQARLDLLADRLQAGTFRLTRNLTPAQVVLGLQENRVVIRTAEVTFREGLRLEQMTAKLLTVEGTQVDPAEFHALVTAPPADLVAEFPWLADERVLPKGASLEGFLYPATYTLRIDELGPTDARGLVRMMLEEFARKVGPERLAVPAARGLTFHQVLTLASIVEREAVLEAEKPLIAGVYQNRLDRIPAVKHGLLQADPTVIWAVDSVRLAAFSPEWVNYVFWTVPDGPGLAEQPLPDALAAWNTYRVRGLPPGPIASPTVSSIDAALNPDTKDRLAFFVAIPDGMGTKGAHDFSKTLAEHRQKLAKYGYR